jgi:hypothetical protein
LPPHIIQHLQSRQQAIDQLFCPSSKELTPLFRNLCQLHVFLQSSAHLAHYLQHPHVFGEQIQELSFIYDSDAGESEILLPEGFEATQMLPNLRRITLANLDITYKYQVGRALLDSLNISTLTHLSTLECQGDMKFAKGLGRIAR